MEQQQSAPSFQVPNGQHNPDTGSATTSSDQDAVQTGLPAPMTGTPTPSQMATDNVNDSVIADDVDVIEKEWVDRAKKVIAMTSADPYSEVKELNKLKAVYLKKRFNKDIPLPGDKK